MHSSVALFLELGVIFTVLAALGTFAHRLRLSPVPLYLLAGLALGRGGIAPVPAAGSFVEAGAEIGVVLLLLTLGLEFSASEFTQSLRRHLPSAGLDVVLNAVPGGLAGWLLGFGSVGVLALAGATWVSSSGIIARLLTDLRRVGNRETTSVLSVLVLEDFAMAAYLPLLAVLASGGTWWQAVLGVLGGVGAVVLALGASQRWGHLVSRLISHPEPEQFLLRVLGITLVVAALAEFVNASAAVGAFLVGLTLTGEITNQARAVLSPLRDLFAAVFFVAIGLSVDPRTMVPLLGPALALAAITAITKVATGAYVASRDSVGRRGQLRAGTMLIVRGEFSIVIIGLAGTTVPGLAALVTAYVFALAITGPLITRLVGRAIPSQSAIA
jgi:monovalent cation:H+ antiporter-2, CPA2 family